MKLFRKGALLTALWIGLTALHAGAADSGGLQFAAIDDQPIITLTREHGMVRGLVDSPLVSIYADGRVLIERPAYMVRPGTFEQRLAPTALNALIQELDQSNTLSLNSKDLAAEHARATQARSSATGERIVVTDPTTTRIHVRFAAFARAGESSSALVNTLSFAELQTQAKQHPSLKSLAALAAAETRLLSLVNQPTRSADGEASQ